MAYGRRKKEGKPLPGTSIKGAGTLTPGLYRGRLELASDGASLLFTSLPHGMHIEQGCPFHGPFNDGVEYDVEIGFVSGCGIKRGKDGKMCAADLLTKEAVTDWYADLGAVLEEAARLKLVFGVPQIIKISLKGELLYDHSRNTALPVCVAPTSSGEV